MFKHIVKENRKVLENLRDLEVARILVGPWGGVITTVDDNGPRTNPYARQYLTGKAGNNWRGYRFKKYRNPDGDILVEISTREQAKQHFSPYDNEQSKIYDPDKSKIMLVADRSEIEKTFREAGAHPQESMQPPSAYPPAATD